MRKKRVNLDRKGETVHGNKAFLLNVSPETDIRIFEYHKESAVDISTSFEWAELLKAIAHPTRLQIVAELLKGTKCVNDIQEILPASQANISQHLTVLRNAGIVSFAQDGSQRCYFVSRPKLVSAILSQLAEGEPATRKTKEEIDQEKHSGGACCVR